MEAKKVQDAPAVLRLRYNCQRFAGAIGSLRRYHGRWSVMPGIRKKVLRDSLERPIAVQIDYADWLEIERSLNLQDEPKEPVDLSAYSGILSLTEDPLEFQRRMRNEWS
jgi:hypothetical protein